MTLLSVKVHWRRDLCVNTIEYWRCDRCVNTIEYWRRDLV